ncbi:MAG: uroporphyrinogen-III synthase [Gammaproteobacteria bacterium]
MENKGLQGCSVVVTRPEAQAQGLAALISDAGGNAILFPTLKITESNDKSALDQLIAELADYSILILISPNAVTFGLNYILQHRPIPATCKIATVGKGSATRATALLQRNIDIVPKAFDGQSGGYNSESLLTLPELQSVNNKKIAILRGKGGRELLADTLRERGATVSYINTYTRSIPDDSNHEKRLNSLIECTNTDSELCVTITSGESLHNFIQLLGNHAEEWLNKAQLIVINERLVAIAKQLGFKKDPLIANNASDHALVDCVSQWCNNK